YDSQRGRCVLFGGENNLAAHYTDTWERNGSTWTQRATSGAPGRSRGAMAFDSQRSRTVMFGGYDDNLNPVAGTWEWDGTTWVQAASSSGPAPRFGIAMAYDSQR